MIVSCLITSSLVCFYVIITGYNSKASGVLAWYPMLIYTRSTLLRWPIAWLIALTVQPQANHVSQAGVYIKWPDLPWMYTAIQKTIFNLLSTITSSTPICMSLGNTCRLEPKFHNFCCTSTFLYTLSVYYSTSSPCPDLSRFTSTRFWLAISVYMSSWQPRQWRINKQHTVRIVISTLVYDSTISCEHRL